MRFSSYSFLAPLFLSSLSQTMTLGTPQDGGLEKRGIPNAGGPCQPGWAPECDYNLNNVVSPDPILKPRLLCMI